jgi:hypothetical protein
VRHPREQITFQFEAYDEALGQPVYMLSGEGVERVES